MFSIWTKNIYLNSISYVKSIFLLSNFLITINYTHQYNIGYHNLSNNVGGYDMIQSQIPKNHISTAVSPMIHNMLHMHSTHSPIRYFDYQRIYHHHQEMICLTSNIHFLDARINLDEPFIEPSLSEGVFLADEVFPVKEIMLDHQHDMYTGICFVKKQENYTETAFFAANSQNKNCISFYFNNTQYLKNFIKDFKEQFNNIISEAEQSKIVITEKLLHKEKSSKHAIHNALSKQEAIVLHYLLKGKTQQNIASIMNISRSTVSTFIHRTMQKFGCHSRSELIEFAWKFGLMQSH